MKKSPRCPTPPTITGLPQYMALPHEPAAPRVSIYYAFFQYLHQQEGWRKFVPGWEGAAAG